MKWIGNRTTFKDNKDNISFVIYPPQIGYKKHLITAWFVLWLLIGTYVTSRFFADFTKEEKLVLFIFMSFWTYYAIRVFRTILYLYYGREFIKLDSISLKIKQATGKYGKSKEFFIENITKFKVESPKENTFKKIYEDSPWVRGVPRIQFEYFGKKYAFGRKLEDKDAEMIFKILTRRIEKQIQRNKAGKS